jgi:hypothetical protein
MAPAARKVAAPIASARLEGPRLGGPPIGGIGRVGVPVATSGGGAMRVFVAAPVNAARNSATSSAHVAGRSAGSFASARWSTSSTPSGSPGCIVSALGTGALTWARASVAAVSLAKGRRPVRSSKATTPSA